MRCTIGICEYEISCPECGQGAFVSIPERAEYLCHGCGSFWTNEEVFRDGSHKKLINPLTGEPI